MTPSKKHDGRLSLTPMIGLTVAGIVLMPLWLWFVMLLGMGGASGITPAYQVVGWVMQVWLASAVIGPVGAWICWYRHQRRWTWWWITLQLQLFGLMVVLLIIDGVFFR